nr:immunoglobulin light chain junction region [Macaca mulatta]
DYYCDSWDNSGTHLLF